MRAKHGESHSPTWRVWALMRQRCNDPKNRSYPRYGGRGIKVCERWNVYLNFVADMGHQPKGMQIDRIDNDRDYEPSNCRWATRLEQAANKSNNRVLTFNGETLHIAEWARRLGCKISSIYSRLNYGWSVERTLGTPFGAVGTNQFTGKPPQTDEQRREYHRNYRIKNRERLRAKRAEWEKKNPDYNKRYYKRKPTEQVIA